MVSFRLSKSATNEDACALLLEELSVNRKMVAVVVQHSYDHGRPDRGELDDALAKIDQRLGQLLHGNAMFVSEKLGVRAALLLFTLQEESDWRNLNVIAARVKAMSIEEAYYWYGKCHGVRSDPARKALQVLLTY